MLHVVKFDRVLVISLNTSLIYRLSFQVGLDTIFWLNVFMVKRAKFHNGYHLFL